MVWSFIRLDIHCLIFREEGSEGDELSTKHITGSMVKAR